MDWVIQADNLKKCYGAVKALQGVSFAVKQGECFGFLGHNGAGKTTTMRMLYGLATVDEGSLWILGSRISLTPPHIKRLMGVVPQEDNLDPDLSVIDNLIIHGRYFGLSRQEAMGRGMELLESLGLSDRRDAGIDELSGGLKRRLVIARALINRPQIVMLDEPTTGLDPEARRLVWQKLRSLKEQGVTLILTSHYMEEAAQLCDRLVIMNEGLILAEGSPAQLVREQVLPCVIEVRLPEDRIPPDIDIRVNQMGGKVERMAEGLFLFTEDGPFLWKQLEKIGLPQHACYLRAAHLEDVFLKLTGKRGETD